MQLGAQRAACGGKLRGEWESLRRQEVQPPHKIFGVIEIIGLLVNAER